MVKIKSPGLKKEGGPWDLQIEPIMAEPKGVNPSPFLKYFQFESLDESENRDEMEIQSLSPLQGTDRLYICHQLEFQKMICGCDKRNRYQIFDEDHLQIWTATEETDFCSRLCTSPIFRPFDIVIRDQMDCSILNLSKNSEVGCSFPLFFCCDYQSLEIYSGQSPRILVGKIEQDSTFRGGHNFFILDGEGKQIFTIRGPPSCPCPPFSCASCGQDKHFDILEGTQVDNVVGRISKMASDCLGQRPDYKFEIKFPREMDVKTKAAILGAAFLIDFLYFEIFERQQVTVANDKENVLRF